MFKAIKEFLFGKLPEQKAQEIVQAPYKVEAPTTVVESAPVEVAPTPAPAPEVKPATKPKKKPAAKKPAGEKKPRKPKSQKA